MIIIPAEIEGISTRKDRTLKIVIGTSELAPSKSGDLFSLQNKVVFVAIKTAEFQKNEVEMLAKANEDIDVQGKTSSERMRNVLWVLFKQDKEGFSDFNDYYRHKMNKFIESLKTKILPTT